MRNYARYCRNYRYIPVPTVNLKLFASAWNNSRSGRKNGTSLPVLFINEHSLKSCCTDLELHVRVAIAELLEGHVEETPVRVQVVAHRLRLPHLHTQLASQNNEG